MRRAAATPTTMPAIAPAERGLVRFMELPGRVVALELDWDIEDDEEEDVEEDEVSLLDDVVEEITEEDVEVERIDEGLVVEATVEGTDDAVGMEEIVPGKGNGKVVAPLDTGLLDAAVSMVGIGMLKKTDPVAVS